MTIVPLPLSRQELLSALVDGELQGQTLNAALLCGPYPPHERSRLDSYHLIGTVLRASDAAVPSADAAFFEHLKRRLANEPLPSTMASGDACVDGAVPAIQLTPAHRLREMPRSFDQVHAGAAKPSQSAANDETFRWKLAAGFASLLAVATVSWVALSPFNAPASLQLAQSLPPQVVVASPQGAMVRDARLEELLAAHRQMGGNAALQVPSGFLRSATFDGPKNTRP